MGKKTVLTLFVLIYLSGISYALRAPLIVSTTKEDSKDELLDKAIQMAKGLHSLLEEYKNISFGREDALENNTDTIAGIIIRHAISKNVEDLIYYLEFIKSGTSYYSPSGKTLKELVADETQRIFNNLTGHVQTLHNDEVLISTLKLELVMHVDYNKVKLKINELEDTPYFLDEIKTELEKLAASIEAEFPLRDAIKDLVSESHSLELPSIKTGIVDCTVEIQENL